MNPEITKIIEQYLANELSPADKIAFEQRLKTNEKLQEELQLQKDIHSASARLHQKTTIQKIGRKRHFRKWMFRTGMFAVVAGILTAGTVFFVNNQTSKNIENYVELDSETEQKLDETVAFSNLPIQRYEIPKDGTVVLSKKGVLISVPENAFLKDGQPYQGKVVLQYQEAISGSDIVKAGLSTMAGDRLLETGGMFAVEGFTEDGESLEFNPEVGVYIQAPMTDNNTEMQLFDGVQLADGTIDWQNPEELGKIPVPVDMSQLDFYPEKYEPKLDELKWKKNKKSRDSLYLSFEHKMEIVEAKTLAEAIPITSIAVIPDVSFCTARGEVPNSTKTILEETDYLFDDKSQVNPNITCIEILKLAEAKYGNDYDRVFSDYYYRQFPEELKAVYESQGIYSDSTNLDGATDAASEAIDAAQECCYLSPSKVLGFWKKKFNNTNLATREFEERMIELHNIGEDFLMEKYINNLDKRISVIDGQIARMGYSKFKSFAAEKIGKVDVSNKHLQNLQAFYENGVKALKEQNERFQKEQRQKDQKWDKKVSQSRQQNFEEDLRRKSVGLSEEIEYNLNDVYKQLGKTRGFTVRGSSGTISSSTQNNIAIKNIDAYVREATINRESAVITDPDTGKKAKITYNDFSVSVKDFEQYDQLFVYVFPNKLNSYQRINGTNGKFKYPLNNSFRYGVAIVGINEKGFYYEQKVNVKKGKLKNIQLTKLSEYDLNASIEQLNSKRGVSAMNVKNELNYLFVEQENYIVQKQRRAIWEFRNIVGKSIADCWEAYYGVEDVQEDTEE